MRRLWVVPIESLKERYSAQWNLWWPKELRRLGIYFQMIWGARPLVDKIERGSFLDVISTNYYKATQLANVMELFHNGRVKDDDCFLFHDLWFPGLEMLAYVRDGLGLKFRIYGCLHAGTYDPYDFLSQKGMDRWGSDLENSWFKIVDGIFVATHFHKDLLLDTRGVEERKIHVTGFPMYMGSKGLLSPYGVGKEKIVVFPHRLDAEKQPEMFDALEMEIKDALPGWKFIKTMEVWDGKKEKYYALLKKARIAVSFANQETWGIAMQEAVFNGCIPIVPDRLSYREMYAREFRFGSFAEACGKVQIAADRENRKIIADVFERNRRHLFDSAWSAIGKMVEVMRNDEERKS